MKLTAKIFLEDRSRYVLGPGRIELLKTTEALGSLHKAAQALGMSYRWAWGRVRDSEKELGFKLLVSQPGGGGGRGTPKVLSPEGRALLRWYEEAERIVAVCLGEALAALPADLKDKLAAGSPEPDEPGPKPRLCLD